MPKEVELLFLDVDGVLTDGSIVINDEGKETKIFNVQDGLGVRLAQIARIKVYIISSRVSKAVDHRSKELKIDGLFQGVKNKYIICNEIASKNKVSLSNTAYIGDDLVDIGVMQSVGWPIAVANAVEQVKKVSCYITKSKGGYGAVREAVEWILKQAEIYDRTISNYLDQH